MLPPNPEAGSLRPHCPHGRTGWQAPSVKPLPATLLLQRADEVQLPGVAPPPSHPARFLMKLLVFNGVPRKKGTVATLSRAVAEGASPGHAVAWIDVYETTVRPQGVGLRLPFCRR